jgi:hypothetical protein
MVDESMVALLGLLLAFLLSSSGIAGHRSTHAQRAGVSKASVRFANVQPIRVVGSSFKPGERVRVRIETGSKLVGRQVTARSNGHFSVQTSVGVDPCLGAFVNALGTRGSHASVTTGMRACPPSERPGGSVRRAPQQ